MAAFSDLHFTVVEELLVHATLGAVLLKAVAAGEVFLAKFISSEGPDQSQGPYDIGHPVEGNRA